MYFSKYNIFSKIKDSDNYFIINILSGNADILEPEKAKEIEEKKFTDISEYINKGYIIDELEENKIFNERYSEFLVDRNNDEIQIFFVPNYSCNFDCIYCYQSEYENIHPNLTFGIIDAFFDYIITEFSGRSKYLTLFGGEPLINSVRQKELIAYFIKKANQSDLEIAIVTNGYYITEFIDIIKKAKIREIQITLDGTEEIHNSRRFIKNNLPSFSKIVKGIDSCLQEGIPINLRMVIDKENIDNLPEFANFAIKKGWTNNALFKTQIGRNYELHHCNSAPEKLFSRITLYEKIYNLIKLYPHILEFYKPAFSISKFLLENGEMPNPLFDSCPACKTEWAFDYTGRIYSCTATVGKLNESLGIFYPEISKNKSSISDWQNRDINSIQQCSSCNLSLACGGGCGSVAKNRTGHINHPDCRPIKELLELGLKVYIENNL